MQAFLCFDFGASIFVIHSACRKASTSVLLISCSVLRARVGTAVTFGNFTPSTNPSELGIHVPSDPLPHGMSVSSSEWLNTGEHAVMTESGIPLL